MNDPSSHSYLGNDLEYCHKRLVFLENEVVEVLLILIPGLVLLPNETLPLRLPVRGRLADSIRMVLLTSSTRDLIIGVVNESVYNRRVSTKVIGTIADIRQRSQIREDSNDQNDLIFLLKGSYRFRIISVRRSDQNTFANITIIPDHSLQFHPYGWLPWNRTRLYQEKLSNLGYGRPFPSWVYNHQNPRNLAESALKLFSTFIREVGEVS
jgi:cereblon